MWVNFVAPRLERARQLIHSGKHAEGLDLYAQLFRQFPDVGLEYGRAAVHCGDFELAVHVWEKVRSSNPANLQNLVWMLAEYPKIGLHTKGRQLLAKAVNVAPRNLGLRLQQAWLLSRTGSVEEARIAVQKCLELDARNETALFLCAHLDRREEKLESAEKQLRCLLTREIDHPRVRHACHTELAHILDRTQRFDAAMAELQWAKGFARKNFPPIGEQGGFFKSQQKQVQEVKKLPKTILADWVKSFPPEKRVATPPLVFLTGSARSGTTLLERILDAHSSVAACDESYAFAKIQPWIGLHVPEIPPQSLNTWRQLYVRNFTIELADAGKHKTLLDKNPSHTEALPALLRVFPEMRMLIALRDPRDIIVSLYFQNQSYTNPLTLDELVQHYSEVMELWLAVREWEGFSWLETRYEDTVAGMEKEGRRVMQFLGLDWHENQARYHEKNREKPILSTNYTDVTRPVYSRSVGRWRVYEKYLEPFLPMLEPYCKKFGYS